MANTVYGPYTAHTWIAGDAINATRLNNIETQSSVALHGFNPDLIGAGFILSGCAASGTVGTTTVNIASGVAYILMTDGTLGRITVGSATQTTSALTSTYNLYLQPDGTFYWSTSNAPQTNSLYLATVATNGSGQISVITDKRTTAATMLSGMAGQLTLPALAGISVTGASSFTGGTLTLPGSATVTTGGTLTTTGNVSTGGLIVTARGGFGGSSPAFTWNSSSRTTEYWSPQTGTSAGHNFLGWNGSAASFPLAIGVDPFGAGTVISHTGVITKVASQASAGSFGVPVIVAQAIATNVTATTSQTIINFTAPATAFYRASATVEVGNATPSALFFRVNYTGGNTNISQSDTFYTSGAGASPINMSGGANTFVGTSEFSTAPLTFYAKTGTAIQVRYTSPSGTPADFVTAIIERLS